MTPLAMYRVFYIFQSGWDSISMRLGLNVDWVGFYSGMTHVMGYECKSEKE